MFPLPSKRTDHSELAPLIQDSGHSSLGLNNENNNDEDETPRNGIHSRSNETTLSGADSIEDSPSEHEADAIRHESPVKFDRNLRNLRSDESGVAEEDGEISITRDAGSVAPKKGKGPIGWMDLPQKGQLAVLTIARLAEPLVQTSLQSYMYYQLKSFDETLPASTIAAQAGIMQSSFTAAQFVTAIAWGRFADSDRGGRKTVLLIGLLGTLLSCVGFGLSRSFWQALFFRSVGGALNGNVGVMRTMISEIVKEKRFQSRAFLLLPMCFNIGVIIGPILGGLLADPAGSYPDRFGKISWLVRYPYAPPNFLSAGFLLIAAAAIFFCLDESHETLRYRRDVGRIIGRKIARLFKHRRSSHDSTEHLAVENGRLAGQVRDVQMSPTSVKAPPIPILRYRFKLPFRRIFTTNVICTLIVHALLSMHVGTFNNLWFVFLSTPVYPTTIDQHTPTSAYNSQNITEVPNLPLPPHYEERLPFQFTGGLGMPPQSVGLAMAILGFIGINLQLWVYPRVNARLGTVLSWRIFLYCFPVAYMLAPYLSIVPSRSPPPHEKDGLLLWLCLCGVLFVQVIGRTFALPASTILLNNCSPHPSVLGTIHGIGHSVSSAARTIGPVGGGWFYGFGLKKGVVGAVWWLLASVAAATVVASNFVTEGDGHEIVLEGDVDEDDTRSTHR